MNLPTTTLGANSVILTKGETTTLPATLRNRKRGVALMSHLQLHQKKSGQHGLPVFYSDNYISLLPGESSTVTIEAATKDLQGDSPLKYTCDFGPRFPGEAK